MTGGFSQMQTRWQILTPTPDTHLALIGRQLKSE